MKFVPRRMSVGLNDADIDMVYHKPASVGLSYETQFDVCLFALTEYYSQ
jgi:hypothetical protein